MPSIIRTIVAFAGFNLMFLIPATAPAQSEQAAVTHEGTTWEVAEWSTKRTWRITLNEDGSTSEKEMKWKLDDRTLRVGESFGRLDDQGRHFVGRGPGPTPFTGRLLYNKLILKTNEFTPPADSGAGLPAANSADAPTTSKKKSSGKSLSDTMVDIFELDGTTRSGRALHLTVDFTADQKVVDGLEEIATWKVDGRRVALKFVDDRLGEAALAGRNTNGLLGKSKGSEGETWSWTLSRVREQAVWDTDGSDYADKVVFYTNGRVTTPRAMNGNGYWWLRGNQLTIWDGEGITLSPDGQTFKGRLPGGAYFSGKLVSGSMGGK